MIKKIVSGGQTGVDQAGLLVAHELGISVEGYCPKGGLDENDNCIRDHLCKELGITKQTLYRHLASNGELREDGKKLLEVV